MRYLAIALFLLASCGSTPCEEYCKTTCYKHQRCSLEPLDAPVCVDECVVDVTKGARGAGEATCEHLDYDLRQMSCAEFLLGR